MKKALTAIAAFAVLFTACEELSGVLPTPTPTPTPEDNELPILITRASGTDVDFMTGDKVGLYVVNYNGSSAGSLAASGNHVDNMCFTYRDEWISSQPIYWLDAETKADFYCYYPYSAQVSNVGKYAFSVASDQRSLENHRASDFLWGKVSGATPSADPVEITLSHKMSRLVISLVAGNGYSNADLDAAEVSVCSVKKDAQVNLSTGAVTAVGSVAEVKPYVANGLYSAYLVPQSVSDVDLVKIVIDNRTYVLRQTLTLEPGKQHKCTITVTKTDQGINIGVSDWIVDSEDYGGIVE